MDEHHVDGQPASPLPDNGGSHHVDLGLAEPEPPKTRRKLSPIARNGLIVGAVMAGLVVALLGVWLLVYSRQPVSVPLIVSLTPRVAEQRLAEHGLKAGNARLFATSAVASGVVIAQEPGAFTQVSNGSSVDVSIAVAPSPQVVANVTNIGQDAAVQALRGQVFVPVVLTQYSASIPIGLVVSQLPRGGDTANSGTNVFVVVSLGPGTRGSVMPSLIGKRIETATSLLATETLFPFTRTASAPGVAGGVVVDQTPAPGSTLMVGSNVALAVTPR